jgi:predicted dehydrogenase
MPLQNVQLKVPSEVLRVVVVGAGSIGREFALRHFGPHTRTAVAAVVDCDGDAAARLAADVGSVAAGAAVKGGG